jgi:hypothetical protein
MRDHTELGNRRMNNIVKGKEQRSMTYHYAGKVHVRGLLRRVWRPRYLALGDDGYLRYHESIPPLYQEDPPRLSPANATLHNINHTHRPKTILAILDGARTIDQHSVVDQHVALPQGVYGFVFRGRPMELYATDSPNIKERVALATRSGPEQSWDSRYVVPREQSAVVFSPGGFNSHVVQDIKNSVPVIASKQSAKAAVVDLVFPKGTSRRRTAQKIAKKAINPDVLCGFVQNNCIGDISRTSSSSSLMDYDQSFLDGEIGQDANMNDLDSNQEWGRDSHESHETIGSFQEVDGIQVYRVHDRFSSPKPEKDKAQVLSSKSTTQVQLQASSIQSREYLCAVSTAEEAESWVVALRWAAEHRRRVRHGNPVRSNGNIVTAAVSHASMSNTLDKSSSGEHVVAGTYRDGSHKYSDIGNNAFSHESEDTSNAICHSTNKGHSGVKFNTLRGSGGDNKACVSSLLLDQDGWCKAEICNTHEECNNNLIGEMADQSTELHSSAAQSSGATIVVTKVSRMNLPWVSWVSKSHCNDTTLPWLPFRLPLPGDDLLLQYEIKLLLLRHCKLRNESLQPETVEERTINKSILDVLAFVRDLMTEFDAVDRGNLVGEGEGSDRSKAQDGVRQTLLLDDTSILLGDIESELLSCVESVVKRGGPHQSGQPKLLMPSDAISEISFKMTEAMASVRTLDSVMRKLSKDRNVCSSNHFQEFLCLHATTLSTPPATSKIKSTQSTQIIFSKEADAEHIVRTWLSKTNCPPCPSTRTNVELALAVALRHRFTGAIISLMAVWSTARLASLVWLMISGTGLVIIVSFENYATLVAVAFFLGHNNGVSSQSQHGKHHLEKHKRRCNDHPMLSTLSVKSKEAELSGDTMSTPDDDHSTLAEEGGSGSDDDLFIADPSSLSSPLPLFPSNQGISCWSRPDHNIFLVRGTTYLEDRIKVPSAPALFQCRGVDVWTTENAERHISRHPSVLGGVLDREDTFVVNFLLPFGNFVAYFTVPPLEEMPENIANVWTKFTEGDQQYRDGKLKLLPVVVDGPWIVKKAVGPGTSPAMIGRDLPLQYYFTEPTGNKKGVYEVDILVTASRIARGIFNVVKGHAKSLTIALAFIIEASEEAELPERALCAFQVHSLHLEDCPNLPDCYPDG